MTTVKTTVTIGISPDGMTLEAAEAAIGAELHQVGRQLLVQACRVMEREWPEQHGAGHSPALQVPAAPSI